METYMTNKTYNRKDISGMQREKNTLHMIQQAFESNMMLLDGSARQLADMSLMIISLQDYCKSIVMMKHCEKILENLCMLDYLTNTYFQNYCYDLNGIMRKTQLDTTRVEMIYNHAKASILKLKKINSDASAVIDIMIRTISNNRAIYMASQDDKKKPKQKKDVFISKSDYELYGTLRKILKSVNQKLQKVDQSWTRVVMETNATIDDMIRHKDYTQKCETGLNKTC